MSEIRSYFTLYGKSPYVQLIITLLIILVIGLALFMILLVSGLLASGTDIGSLAENLKVDSGEENINLLRYLVIIQDISFFIVPAIIVRYYLLPENQKNLRDFKWPSLNEIAIIVLLAFCLFPVTGITGELNSSMKLPDWLSGVEEWMRLKEDEAAGLVDLLLPSDSVGSVFLNLFIVAALPAFSEEIIFRGVFQRIFYGFFKSPNTAIWLTALLFSAFHFQFYGFVPRLILGLSFGYLYYWGGSLWLPILAHFINNAVPVVGAYFQDGDIVTAGPDISLWTQVLILPGPVIIIVFILLYFRNKFNRELKVKAEVVAENGSGPVLT